MLYQCQYKYDAILETPPKVNNKSFSQSLQKIKLIITDLDHTLLYKVNRIHRANIAAFQKLVAHKDYHITVVSGRGLKRITKILRKMKCADAPVILAGFNGSLGYDNGQKKVLWNNPFSPDDAQYIFKVINKYKVEAWSYSASTYNLALVSQARRWWIYSQNFEKRFQIKKFNVDSPESVNKVVIKIRTTLADMVLSKLIKHNAYSIFKGGVSRNKKYAIYEINPVNTDKANACKRIAAHFNLSSEQAMVIADGHNDLKMMQWAGTAIAVANAEGAIKSVAHEVVTSSKAGGFAAAVAPLLKV